MLLISMDIAKAGSFFCFYILMFSCLITALISLSNPNAF